jgi:hypothetical protein
MAPESQLRFGNNSPSAPARASAVGYMTVQKLRASHGSSTPASFDTAAQKTMLIVKVIAAASQLLFKVLSPYCRNGLKNALGQLIDESLM